jgi:6-phosphogluconolactonase (cycloisomerase 2 family)
MPFSVAVGDFDRDVNRDLTVVNYGSDNISVFLGNEDGTFESAVFYGVGNSPRAVAIADFNSDGKTDLAVVNAESDDVTILFNTPENGRFKER